MSTDRNPYNLTDKSFVITIYLSFIVLLQQIINETENRIVDNPIDQYPASDRKALKIQ